MIKFKVWPLVACLCLLSWHSKAQEVDTSIIYGLPQDPTYLEEDRTYFDALIDNTASSWSAESGCLVQSQNNGGDGSWGGTSGGSCANIGVNGDGAIRFGWIGAQISQTQSVLSDALKGLGINVVGYLWQWRVKNYNSNDTSINQTSRQDPLSVTVTFKDTSGETLYTKTYDYSYTISNWTQQYGTQLFDPWMGDEVDTVTLSVYGKDAGGWAGYWGPEFREGQIYGLYTYTPPKEEEDKCLTDPSSSPLCPGYANELMKEQDALLEAIANNTSTESLGQDPDVAFVEEVKESVEQSTIDTPQDIAVQEAINEQTQVVEETTAAIIEETSSETNQTASAGEESAKQSPTGNVNPLSVAQNAVSSALSDANKTISSTLDTTIQSVEDSQNISNDINQTNSEIASVSQELDSQATSIVTDSMDQYGSSSETDTQTDNISVGVESLTDSNMSNPTGDITISDLDNQNQINNITNESETNSSVSIEIVVDNFQIAALNMAIDAVFAKVLNKELETVEDSVEESNESTEDQNAKEDALVEKALSGDDSEDAQAALLGYNPQFRAYQTPILPDGQLYKPKEIYGEQKNYDNPNQRFFNGASDVRHREMVRQQYNN